MPSAFPDNRKQNYKQKEFCDIGLVVNLGDPCQLCQRILVHADCEKWLKKSKFRPFANWIRFLFLLTFLSLGMLSIRELSSLFSQRSELSYLGAMILGKSTLAEGSAAPFAFLNYPFTIQNITILLFFIGLGEAFYRAICGWREKRLINSDYLPQNKRVVLDMPNLARIRRNIGDLRSDDQGFLFVLIDLCIKRFINSQSVQQTQTALNGRLELLSHRLHLRYTLLRYLIWVIPTIGFIGTVLGISGAIMAINPANVSLESVVDSLGVAFNTTLVALVLSAALNFFYSMALAQEEDALNRAGNLVINNMINRLDPMLDQDELRTQQESFVA